MAKRQTHAVESKSGTAGKPSSGKMADFIGRLKGRSKKIATLEEINQAAARGWAGRKVRRGTPSPQ
jgi:hypothetical protein